MLCEAEGDRLVYESTYRTFEDRRLDIRFVPSEGTGGFADPLRLYRALDIPSAIIADLDFLAKDGELKKVLTELGTPKEEVAKLCGHALQAITRIRSEVSHVDPQEMQNELKELGQEPIDLAKNEDEKLRRKLLQLARRLYRLHDLQQRGLEAIPEKHTDGGTTVSLRDDVRSLLDDLQSHRLFLVPEGELESWLPIVMKGQSREDKSKWAMLAAEKIEDNGERNEGVWQFIHSVYDRLHNQFRTFGGV